MRNERIYTTGLTLALLSGSLYFTAINEPTEAVEHNVLVTHDGNTTEDVAETVTTAVRQSTDELEELIRDSLGNCEGDAGFNADADVNGDGCVNILDLAAARNSGLTGRAGDEGAQPIGPSETIIIEEAPKFVEAATTFSALVRLDNNTTPLFGYSIDVEMTPLGDATGSVNAIITMTNFYEQQNLITQGGAELDPDFSLVIDPGDGGVFVTANTDDGSTVLADDGVNDMLAQVFFEPTLDATGEFMFELGPASALSDGDGFSVPFAFQSHTILVFPNAADINEDGCVNTADLLQVLAGWGDCPPKPAECPEDIDDDGSVGTIDLLILLAEWECKDGFE